MSASRGGAPRTVSAASPTRGRDPVRVQAPIVPRPTGEAYRAEVAYGWLNAGEVTLEDGRLSTPTLGGSPGIYRFALCDASGEVASYYVGETDDLARRMNGYRNPGATQATNSRMNPRLRAILAAGGSVSVNVVLEATLGGSPLDFGHKPARLVVENAELVRLKGQGALIENLGSES